MFITSFQRKQKFSLFALLSPTVQEERYEAGENESPVVRVTEVTAQSTADRRSNTEDLVELIVLVAKKPIADT